MPKPVIPILYCGSSFTKSLFDTLLELGTRPVLFPSDTELETLQKLDPLCLMISGSPEYVNSPLAPTVDQAIYEAGIPILGICYGMQRMAADLGGEVKRLPEPERECQLLEFVEESPSVLYRDFTEEGASVWMAHICVVSQEPPGFTVTGFTEVTDIASMEDESRGFYAVQFHPEHKGRDPSSQAGTSMLWNFLNGVCGHDL